MFFQEKMGIYNGHELKHFLNYTSNIVVLKIYYYYLAFFPTLYLLLLMVSKEDILCSNSKFEFSLSTKYIVIFCINFKLPLVKIFLLWILKCAEYWTIIRSEHHAKYLSLN